MPHKDPAARKAYDKAYSADPKVREAHRQAQARYVERHPDRRILSILEDGAKKRGNA